MKRLLTSIFAAVALALGLLATPIHATADNGTGAFWVYDGANATGSSKFFNVGPNRTVQNWAALTYDNGSPLNNTVSSVRLSCGLSGTTFSSLDWFDLYDADIPSGTAYRQSTAGHSCVGGVYTFNVPAAINNKASSMVTHNGG